MDSINIALIALIKSPTTVIVHVSDTDRHPWLCFAAILGDAASVSVAAVDECCGLLCCAVRSGTRVLISACDPVLQ